MAKLPHPKKLLVEGPTDRAVISQLIETRTGLHWGDAKKSEPVLVDIEPFEGCSEMFKPGVVEARLNESGRQALGLIVDADEDPQARWEELRACCIRFYPDFPASPPSDGLHLTHARGVRLGAWMMPDNQGRGMLETFLALMRPPETNDVWAHADAACTQAKQLKAPYKDVHRDKAVIHTWLSWQHPPDQRMHEAIKDQVLSHETPQSKRFVAWFKKLFDL